MYRVMSITMIFAAIAGAGCASRPFALEARFDDQGAAEMLQPGKNSIRGSGLLRQQGGGVVTCAGKTVNLIPATVYATEWVGYEFEWAGGPTGYGIRHAGSRPYNYLHPPGFLLRQRSTTCDAAGFFAFEDVGDGSFYITTDVSWMVGYTPQGGRVARIVHTAGGKRHDVVITN